MNLSLYIDCLDPQMLSAECMYRFHGEAQVRKQPGPMLTHWTVFQKWGWLGAKSRIWEIRGAVHFTVCSVYLHSPLMWMVRILTGLSFFMYFCHVSDSFLVRLICCPQKFFEGLNSDHFWSNSRALFSRNFFHFFSDIFFLKNLLDNLLNIFSLFFSYKENSIIFRNNSASCWDGNTCFSISSGLAFSNFRQLNKHIISNT